MKRVRTLTPGENGTKSLLKKYGDKLFCVRYRYDLEKRQCLKTVELVVERRPWINSHKYIPPNKMMLIKIKYGEPDLGRLVRAAGGKWNRVIKLWELPYHQVQALDLENRIVNLSENV
ncbi:hypothetical protein HQ585_02150 [candidate division KSB1 bacterium]|nr:hypothetical protein [candidate division KSB1 bacterium]